LARHVNRGDLDPTLDPFLDHFLSFLGETLNIMTLGGLALAVEC